MIATDPLHSSKNFAQNKKRMFTHRIINGASKIDAAASVSHTKA